MLQTEGLLASWYGKWQRVPRYPLLLLVLTPLVICTGCSQRAWYDGMQHSQRNECALVPDSELEDCLARKADSYDEYKRKRDALTE